MHKALTLEPILANVFENASQGTALSFALCSRHLFREGIRVIWRSAQAQDLVQAIPGHFIKYLSGNPDHHNCLAVLSEIPRHAGWLGPRFTLYASFMTQITIEACQPDNWLDVLSKDEYPLSDYFLVDHDLFHALTECTEEPIFPALECLTVAWNPDVDNRNTALAFINPRLEELRVFVEFRRSETPLDVDMLLEFLENAQQRASGIRIVNVVGFIEEDDKPADAIPCVPGLSGWTNLTEFELPFAISDAVWNILTTLTSLRTLWVEAVELRPSPRSYMFPSLEVICLASIPLSTALVVLGSLQAPNLKEINMTGDGQGSIKTYSHLFSLLAQHCKLEVLSLDFGEGQPADDGSSETNHMDISVIAPILESCSLKSFSADLQLHEPEDHNSIIIACQTAWHQLHSLEFSYNGKIHFPTSIDPDESG